MYTLNFWSSLAQLLGTEASLVAQTVKCLPTMRETRVRSLGQEDSLEKERATHSSILAWRISWTEEPGGLQSMGLHTTEQLHSLHFSLAIFLVSNNLLTDSFGYHV